MNEFQIGKDIQSILQRLDALEGSASAKDCACEEDEEEFTLTSGMISVQSFPLSDDTYIMVVRVQTHSPLAQYVRAPDRGPSLQHTQGGERIIVAFGSADAPVKPGDFVSPEALVNGRGYYKKRRSNGSCRTYDHDENCVDCQAYLNRLYDRSSGLCGYFGYCVSPPTCLDDAAAQKKTGDK